MQETLGDEDQETRSLMIGTLRSRFPEIEDEEPPADDAPPPPSAETPQAPREKRHEAPEDEGNSPW